MYKVLIVDDDPMVRSLVSKILEMKGHQCDQASDGVDGLEKAQNKNYNALVVDIVMPRMDGLTLLRRIHEQFPDLPVMLMTGFNRLSYLKQPIDEEAFRAGASDFINKPFSVAEFSTRFQKMMTTHETLLQMKARQREIERKSSEMIAALQRESMAKIEALKKEHEGAGTSQLRLPGEGDPSTVDDQGESILALDHAHLRPAPEGLEKGGGHERPASGDRDREDAPSGMDAYSRQIQKRIYSNWNIPVDSRQEMSGLEAGITFEIQRDGKIRNIRLEKKTGNPRFDDISLLALKNAEPLPPFPPEMTDESIEITMVFKRLP
jgi:TonB family protein